jgi:hypothetical protein
MLPSSELVVLRGGLSVPLPALQILWDLEQRCFSVTVSEDGLLKVRPGEQLTEHDRQRIRQHRDALVMLVQYVAPPFET